MLGGLAESGRAGRRGQRTQLQVYGAKRMRVSW